MTAARATAGLVAALLLAACSAAAPPAPPQGTGLSGPGLPLRVAMTGEPARMLLERVAAACWLDHVVHGGSMIVDRGTGRIVITSDTEDLLIAEIAPAGDGSSLVRLTGTATEEPATVLRLSKTLETAAETGRAGCAPSA